MSSELSHSSTCNVLEEGTGCTCRIIQKICQESGCSTPIENCRKYCEIHANKCVHGKRRERCKTCGGRSIFHHNKIKSRCTYCGG